jgi:hypothetical protein
MYMHTLWTSFQNPEQWLALLEKNRMDVDGWRNKGFFDHNVPSG